MATIKDRIDIFTAHVEAFKEVADQYDPELPSEPTTTNETVDTEDPIENLLASAVAQKYPGVQISRQSTGLYSIQGKSVTVVAEGDNNDQLKVLVDSSWFSFDDYMTSVSGKMEKFEGEIDDKVVVEG